MADDPLLRDRARRLRREPTDAALKLWSRLRNRKLGFKFRREHPIGPYIADFCCLEAGLILELDGDQHGEAGQRRYDEVRTQWLKQAGFRVLRFWDGEVLKEIEGVLHQILGELSKAQS